MKVEKFAFETTKTKTNLFEIERPNFSESIFNFPGELSEGEVRFIQLQADLGINIVRQRTLSENVVDKTDGTDGLLQFAFYLSCNNVSAETESLENKVFVNSGDSYVLPPILHAQLGIPRNQRFDVVLVQIGPSRLFPFVKEAGNLLPEGFIHLLEDNKRYPYFHGGKITPAMQVVLHQIVHCPYQGALKHIFLESKSLELIVLRMEQMVRELRPVPVQRLRSKDVESIRYARELLIDKIDNPPSLSELARLAAININKLKYGFREVFGTSVFSYLRHQRLDLAHLFLIEGELNVGEAAQAVGYKDLSYFTEAFRRKFGINPSKLLRK
ncbi:MAG: AraC family transcriptional regulator [Spirochaetales bacterium]|nr:MAG: AraC family transcriptional regulator [Spirochaetales bacterium]